MAKQAGIFKVKGTLDDVSFYKSKDGYLVRTKGGVDGDRIAKDPAFQRTRENNAEFATAGKSGKLLRNSLQALLQQAKDSRVVSRLTQKMMTIVKTDSVNPRGERTVENGDLSLLKEFEFNTQGKLATTLFAPFESAFDRVTGGGTIDLAPFSPLERLVAPTGATHFSLGTGTVEIDFEGVTYTIATDATGPLPYDGMDTAAIALSATVTANSVFPVIQVLGVTFYQEVNGTLYPLKNGAYNALAIVTVNLP